tara:strand:+ start:931 stop:1428 length:498 start_codon:yes stop_codon:yes gene_type:complete
MTDYDPRSLESRRALAADLIGRLEAAGFDERETKKGREREFELSIVRHGQDTGWRIVVYTSVVCQAARAVATDAIRVVALHTTSQGRTVVATKGMRRVNRTGAVEAISERALARCREAWEAAVELGRCPSCGAPNFRSKKGNVVCAELCWTSYTTVPMKRRVHER